MYYKNAKELLIQRIIERFQSHNYICIDIPRVDGSLLAFYDKEIIDKDTISDPSMNMLQKIQFADIVIHLNEFEFKFIKNRYTNVDLLLFLMNEPTNNKIGKLK